MDTDRTRLARLFSIGGYLSLIYLLFFAFGALLAGVPDSIRGFNPKSAMFTAWAVIVMFASFALALRPPTISSRASYIAVAGFYCALIFVTAALLISDGCFDSYSAECPS
jgi:ABC-type branched-subunit amino acid transport system permease subunit